MRLGLAKGKLALEDPFICMMRQLPEKPEKPEKPEWIEEKEATGVSLESLEMAP